ncbi:hypothetical protein GGX14DRAFT_619215 [Mycena pura]|uniref:Uncharacterized protein n=1 Tax=Mycena pura TaxID=153505 RepID=A0AAD6VI66_9AGAR|nr:hypothetical protein GGX14DRAFT_619215 [Mycena pura]
MQLAFDPSCARHCTPRQTTPSVPAPPLCTPAPLLCTPAPPSARRSRQLDAAPPATSQPHRLRAACALYILRALCMQPVPSAHCLRPLHVAPRRLHAAPAVCIPLPPIVRRPPPFARRPRHLHAARALCTSPHPLHAAPAPCTPPSPSACYPPPFARRRCPSSPTHAPLSVCGLVLDARRRCRPATPRAAPRGFDALLPLRGLVLTARSRRRTWERVRLVFDTLRHCHPCTAPRTLMGACESLWRRHYLAPPRARSYEHVQARFRHPALLPCSRTLMGACARPFLTLRAAALYYPAHPPMSVLGLVSDTPRPRRLVPPRARSRERTRGGFRRCAPPLLPCTAPCCLASPRTRSRSVRGLVCDVPHRHHLTRPAHAQETCAGSVTTLCAAAALPRPTRAARRRRPAHTTLRTLTGACAGSFSTLSAGARRQCIGYEFVVYHKA